MNMDRYIAMRMKTSLLNGGNSSSSVSCLTNAGGAVFFSMSTDVEFRAASGSVLAAMSNWERYNTVLYKV